jgi:hypothetical protein
MFGALSSTDGVLDSDTEVTVGLYERVGEFLCFEYNGKLGSRYSIDIEGVNRSTNRVFSVLSVFLRGTCGADTPGAFDVALRALPASRKKSTMPASAAFCLPTSDGVMRAPKAAVVLFAPDMSEADSSKEGLLWRRMR